MRNPMAEEKFLVHELAEQAQTTVRTIRYYTDEGLLPQPEIQGKFAYYTQNHLNRLKLIRRMKDSYLPLREIRQIMASLADEEVGKRLQEQALSGTKSETELNPPQPAPQAGSKALEYISRLMEEQAVFRSKETRVPPQSSQPANRNAAISSMNDSSGASSFLSEGENWQRISLARGVELHLLTPADMDTTNRIRQLIAFAQKLFR